MAEDDLARAVRELSGLTASAPHKCLRRLVEMVAQAVPGCAGATSTLWQRGELTCSTASHPDLAALLDRQLARGSGPVLDAVRTGTPAHCADTLAELDARDGRPRWPEYAADALGVGVRCSATLVHRSGGLLVTLTLYGTKPRALGPAAASLASLLAVVGGISLDNATRYESSRRLASQLEEDASARAVVEQAKGLLMNAQRCNADEALARLRQLSQGRHVEVAEAARWLIEEHARAKDPPRPAPGGGPGTRRRPADGAQT
jgi:ANTAR domain